MRKRTAVLVHGCHLQADCNGENWEQIVWGLAARRPTLYGRATMGLKVALNEGAELVIFSTGASERNGVKEGEYTFRYALVYTKILAEELGVSLERLDELLRQQVELDLESQNTTQECTRNLTLCAKRGIETVKLVSSAWHIERCHAEALSVAETLRQDGVAVPHIEAVGSYGSARQVTILEPPHRGDRPRTRWHELARAFFKVPEDKRLAFEADFEKLVSKYDN